MGFPSRCSNLLALAASSTLEDPEDMATMSGEDEAVADESGLAVRPGATFEADHFRFVVTGP